MVSMYAEAYVKSIIKSCPTAAAFYICIMIGRDF